MSSTGTFCSTTCTTYIVALSLFATSACAVARAALTASTILPATWLLARRITVVHANHEITVFVVVSTNFEAVVVNTVKFIGLCTLVRSLTDALLYLEVYHAFAVFINKITSFVTSASSSPRIWIDYEKSIFIELTYNLGPKNIIGIKLIRLWQHISAFTYTVCLSKILNSGVLCNTDKSD